MAKRSREAKRELKQSQFWAMPLNRKWPFISFLDDGFAEIFSQIISIRVKKRSNTKFNIVNAYWDGKCLTSGWRPLIKNAFPQAPYYQKEGAY